jgi:hypothetical protein
MGEHMNAEIGYSLSPLARAYVASEHTMARDVARTCSPEVVQKLLQHHGLPVSQAIQEFEAQLGGWCSTNPLAEVGYGVYLSLQQEAHCSAVATKLRSRNWLFDGRRDAPDESGQFSPLWGTGYPRVFFQDRALVPAGMLGADVLLLLGEAGEVYAWVDSLGELLLRAGCGRTLLERFGLMRYKGQHWFEIHICGDVGAFAAEMLDVTHFQPACDQHFQWWANEAIQICCVPDYAPCIMGTHIACADERDFETLMRRLVETNGGRPLKTWARANNINDQAGRQLLSNFGIDHETLYGAGPGNYDLIYDNETGEERSQPSSYDTSGWR